MSRPYRSAFVAISATSQSLYGPTRKLLDTVKRLVSRDEKGLDYVKYKSEKVYLVQYIPENCIGTFAVEVAKENVEINFKPKPRRSSRGKQKGKTMTPEDIEAKVKEKGLTAPRVSLEDLESNIVTTEIVTFKTVSGQVLRGAVITTKSGFSVAGDPSASASSENDNEEIGRERAIQNARNKLWPLMGYALRERLHRETN